MLTMRPQASEYADYYARYIGRVPDGQWRARLEAQADEYRALVAGLDEDTAGLPTAPGKWSVTQTLMHVADAERVFAFRLLWFARADGAAPRVQGQIRVRCTAHHGRAGRPLTRYQAGEIVGSRGRRHRVGGRARSCPGRGT